MQNRRPLVWQYLRPATGFECLMGIFYGFVYVVYGGGV